MKKNLRNVFMNAFAFMAFLFLLNPLQAQTKITDNTPAGTETFTIPADVFVITVEVWGGGGRGGSRTTQGEAGGGGGGGYSSLVINVLPGQVYNYQVGSGSTSTAPGGQSWFGTAATVMANGGLSVANNSTVGVAGAVIGIGAVSFSGGKGADDNPASNGAGGGGSSAGTNANGTNATGNAGAPAPTGGGNGGAGADGNNSVGTIGTPPGGGGGGADKQGGGPGEIAGGAGGHGQVQITYTEPIPTPVKFKSFTAARKQTNVELSWVTVMEQNNYGFELQRQSGSGGWQTVGFVASKSEDGNSNEDLIYQYADANNAKGVSQYRLKQVDLDNKFEYSQVRAVHGMSQSGRTLVAPNPSKGSLNVLFESTGQRDLLLTDMAGRIMRQWNNYNDNSVQISNLTPGSYQLRILDRETNTQSVEKIMVVNR